MGSDATDNLSDETLDLVLSLWSLTRRLEQDGDSTIAPEIRGLLERWERQAGSGHNGVARLIYHTNQMREALKRNNITDPIAGTGMKAKRREQPWNED